MRLATSLLYGAAIVMSWQIPGLVVVRCTSEELDRSGNCEIHNGLVSEARVKDMKVSELRDLRLALELGSADAFLVTSSTRFLTSASAQCDDPQSLLQSSTPL